MDEVRSQFLGVAVSAAIVVSVFGLYTAATDSPEVELCLDPEPINLVGVTRVGRSTVLVSKRALVRELIESVSSSLRERESWHSFMYRIFEEAVVGDDYIYLSFSCNERNCPDVLIDSDGRFYVVGVGVFRGNRELWNLCVSLSKEPLSENVPKVGE